MNSDAMLPPALSSSLDVVNKQCVVEIVLRNVTVTLPGSHSIRVHDGHTRQMHTMAVNAVY